MLVEVITVQPHSSASPCIDRPHENENLAGQRNPKHGQTRLRSRGFARYEGLYRCEVALQLLESMSRIFGAVLYWRCYLQNMRLPDWHVREPLQSQQKK